jgi:hypothetical protein
VPAPLPGGASALATPSATTSAELSGSDPVDVEVAFLSNVDDLIAEATDLATLGCDDLTVATSDNPSLLPSLRGYAGALHQVAASQTTLNTSAVSTALADLDRAMSDLDGTLSQCGIPQR